MNSSSETMLLISHIWKFDNHLNKYFVPSRIFIKFKELNHWCHEYTPFNKINLILLWVNSVINWRQSVLRYPYKYLAVIINTIVFENDSLEVN